MKSLTFSESCRANCLPCGVETTAGVMLFSNLSDCRPLTREQCKELQSRLRLWNVTLFGAGAFETLSGSFRAVQVFPWGGRVGWGRNPIADRWHVTRADGSTVFRTQNYSALLRWFYRKAVLCV